MDADRGVKAERGEYIVPAALLRSGESIAPSSSERRGERRASSLMRGTKLGGGL